MSLKADGKIEATRLNRLNRLNSDLENLNQELKIGDSELIWHFSSFKTRRG